MLLVCLLWASAASAADNNELFEIFMNYETALTECDDARCYRAVLNEYGSEATRHRLAQFDDQQVKEHFDLVKSVAVDHVEKAELRVVSTAFEDKKATLELANKTYPGLTETVFFVREDDAWKIGAD